VEAPITYSEEVPHTVSTLTASRRISAISGEFLDTASGRRIIAAQPSTHPELWSEYLHGALRNYRHFGVEIALDYDQMFDGHTTSLFFVAVDPAGTVGGGLRIQGPFSTAAQAHAPLEWAGRPGALQLHREIRDRLPAGLVEFKALWVDHETDRRSAITAALARCFAHAMHMLDARYGMCSAAAHVIPRWTRAGGTLGAIPSVPYPNDRYQTSIMWWDAQSFDHRFSSADLTVFADERDQLETTSLWKSVA
jgi:hypothetical protein